MCIVGVGQMTENEYEVDVKTVSRDGVIVERELVDEGDGIAGTLEVESRRDDPVFVHVVEDLPSTLAVDDATFERGLEPDIGDISSERVSVRHNVADESVRIRYGIVTSASLAEHEWTSPIVESVSETELTRSTSAGPSTGAPRTAPDPLGEESDEIRTGDTPETARDSSADDEGHDEYRPGSSADEHVRETEETTADGATDAPDDAAWSDAERRAMQAEVPRSLQVRIDHLGARVQEFSAYASSLEALIDERGTASEIVEGLERDLEGLGGRLDRLQVDVESLRVTHDEDIDGLRASVDRIDSAVDGVEAEIDALQAKFDERESEVDDLRGEVDSHRDRFDDHASALDEHGERLDEHEERFDEHESALDEYDADLGGIEDEVDSVENNLQALEDRVDAFEDDIEQFAETLERMETELASVPEDVRTLSEELEALREEMEQFRSFRKSLAEISNVDQ